MAALPSRPVQPELRDIPNPPNLPKRFATESPPIVTIHHPSYISSRLLDLPAFDGTDEFPAICHGTLLLVCGLLADNHFDGWLSSRRDGQRLEIERNGLLPAGDYYYHVPNPATPTSNADMPFTPYKWPVVPAFSVWQFPHNNIPEDWKLSSGAEPVAPTITASSRSNASLAAKLRDFSCCVSLEPDGIEGAHLCPEREDEWYRAQEMDRYNPLTWMSGAKPVNNPANMITLSASVHTVFDAKAFVFTRKQGCWVSHYIGYTGWLGAKYHNTRVNMPAGVHPNFILARLAWAIFPMIESFLRRGEPRLVRVASEDEQEMTSAILRDTFFSRGKSGSPAKSRSASPQKRPRSDCGDTHEDADEPSQKRRLRSLYSSQSIEASFTTASLTSELTCHDPEAGDVAAILTKDDEGTHVEASTSTIVKLRREALAIERQKNADCMCCDYDAAEAAIMNGEDGFREFGGAHICQLCLGFEREYEDD